MQEVTVPNTSYSKLVAEDGSVAVVLANDYGGGWSSSEWNSSIKHQMMFDSRLARYVLSYEYTRIFARESEQVQKNIYMDLMNSIFPDNYPGSFSSFTQLTVKFIPKGTLFRIKEYDGLESVVIFDPCNYFTA